MILSEDAKKFPFYHALIVLFLSVGLCEIPLFWFFELFITDTFKVKLIEGIFKRLILSIVGIIFIYKYKFFGVIKNKISIISFISIIPAILVAINNFPIVGLIKGDVIIRNVTTNKFLFISYCFCVGLYEEIFFRGIIFPLCFIKLKHLKNNIIWSIVLSSVLFSVMHLLNLFTGETFLSALLQVGYSFLIGSMLCICLVKTGNLFISIIIHFIYDIGGMILGEYGIANGTQWDIITIIITVTLSILVGIYMLFMALKFKEKDINRLFSQE